MKRFLVAVSLLAVTVAGIAVGADAAQPAPPVSATPPPATPAPSPPATPPAKPPAAESPSPPTERFEPSERVRADFEVSFPVDI
jgi:hypothetical protein